MDFCCTRGKTLAVRGRRGMNGALCRMVSREARVVWSSMKTGATENRPTFLAATSNPSQNVRGKFQVSPLKKAFLSALSGCPRGCKTPSSTPCFTRRAHAENRVEIEPRTPAHPEERGEERAGGCSFPCTNRRVVGWEPHEKSEQQGGGAAGWGVTKMWKIVK